MPRTLAPFSELGFLRVLGRRPAPRREGKWRSLALPLLRGRPTLRDQPAGSASDQPRPGVYVVLWGTLVLITLVPLLAPGLPVAIQDGRLSVAVGSVSAVVALGLLMLGVLRFRLLRRAIDLHAGLAFGVLAFTHLYTAWAAVPLATTDALDRATYVLLLTRAMAAGLFLAGLASSRRGLRSLGPWPGWLGLACATLLGLLSASVWLGGTGELPPLLDGSARALLVRGESVPDFLSGQQPPLIMGNVLLTVALLVSAIGYTSAGRDLRDPHIATLAAGLALIVFGQLHAVFFPVMPAAYVSTGDAFRLIAYGFLLSSVLWRTAEDVAIAAGQDERLRLSRELHDGLAQQLAALRLRLGHVAEATLLSDSRTHDLEVAQRVLDSAALEARRAIAALRSEGVPWEEFEQALTACAAEFALTHDIDARVWAEPSEIRIQSHLQGDVLRILQEAFSNAARHGHARRIDAVVARERNRLHVSILDDGQGFDPARRRQGVGLKSMTERVERRGGQLRVDTSPGEGTRVQVWLPMRSSAPGQLA